MLLDFDVEELYDAVNAARRPLTDQVSYLLGQVPQPEKTTRAVSASLRRGSTLRDNSSGSRQPGPVHRSHQRDGDVT